MQASNRSFISIISDKSIRFEIPFFQRPYSWRREQLQQLWEDIIAIAKNPHISATHFTGSLVYAHAAYDPSGVTTCLLIDGQQRFTTLELLLIAFAEFVRRSKGNTAAGTPLGVIYEQLINEGYIYNQYRSGDLRYRISLSESDKKIFFDVVDHLIDPEKKLEHKDSLIIDALNFFSEKINSIEDQSLVWRGLSRLAVVFVSLDATDNPQLVFESMNSTGKALTQSDLVRNYVLLGLSIEDQKRFYELHWRPIELNLKINRDERSFDDFMFYYLQVNNRVQKVVYRDIYREFKRCTPQGSDINPVLQSMHHFSELYGRIRFPDTEENKQFREHFRHFKNLNVAVSSSLLMCWYDFCKRGLISETEFSEMMTVLKNYLVRRFICKYASNVYANYFFRLMTEFEALLKQRKDIENFSPAEALTALLEKEKGTNREFPDDELFKEQLQSSRIYAEARSRLMYLLLQLEKSFHPKYGLNEDENFTIEHIMPQTISAGSDWEEMLDTYADKKHEDYVHRLGNLTLTAYNSELSNLSFIEKRDCLGGYEQDAISLSNCLKNKESWTLEDIEERGIELSERCANVWKKITITPDIEMKYGTQRCESRNTPEKSISTLMANGLLSAGARLHARESGAWPKVTATITENGELQLSDGSIRQSLSTAAVDALALANCRKVTMNGWEFWAVDKDGREVKLNELFNEFIDNMNN